VEEWRGSVGIGGCAGADGTRQTPRQEGGKDGEEEGRGLTKEGGRKAWTLKWKAGTEGTGRFVPFRSERLAVNNHQ
jgi:hypothetical protein